MTTTEEAPAAVAEPPEQAAPGTAVATRTASATLPDKIAYARELAESGLLPSAYRKQPANVLYAVEYGDMIGLAPMAAITGIHIIEGKPTASAALISGLVRRAGHKLRVTGNDRQATAQLVRSDDQGFTYEATWTLDRAVTAGLCTIKDGKAWSRDSKGRPLPWEKYPAAMLKARAVTEVARDACEEVLFGLHYTPEELGAEVDEDGNVLGSLAGAADAMAEARQATRTGDPEWTAQALERAAAWTDWDSQGRKLWAETGEKLHAGQITKSQADTIAEVIKGRKAELDEAAAAADGPVDAEIPEPPAMDPDDPWADKIADLASQEECDAAEAEIFELVKHRQMAEARGDLITAHIRYRAAGLAGERAAA